MRLDKNNILLRGPTYLECDRGRLCPEPVSGAWDFYTYNRTRMSTIFTTPLTELWNDQSFGFEQVHV